jgi:uncharacterized protein
MGQVKVVRIYLSESEKKIKHVLDYLRDDAKVKGATVFRGIAGFGDSGLLHQASIVDWEMELPIVIEFFDSPSNTDNVIQEIMSMIKPGHIISWLADNNQ